MFKLKLLGIIAIAVLSCWLAPWVSDYAGRKADRLEQMGTGADPDRPVVLPPAAKQPVAPVAVDQGRDDFQRPRVKAQASTQPVDDFDLPRAIPDESTRREGQPPTLVQVDPVRQEMLRQAIIYRNISVAARKYWWIAPLVFVAMLLPGLRSRRYLGPCPGEVETIPAPAPAEQPESGKESNIELAMKHQPQTEVIE